ncbi:hypothetical protein [Nostoc sp.]|uniref:hypothetical protein n=1 Tax=Nostoc sp. TaxID=1180 RepID=UPI002FF64EE3
MKTRNAFVTLTICLVLVVTTAFFVNIHKVSAQPIRDCHKLVTGTYLTPLSGDKGQFYGITMFNRDGNFVSSASTQTGNSSFQPFSNVQGSWECTSDREITATGLDFNYPTATLPGSITRTDFRATFDPKAGIVQATAKLRSFSLNANPLNDDAPVTATLTFTGQRVKAGQ